MSGKGKKCAMLIGEIIAIFLFFKFPIHSTATGDVMYFNFLFWTATFSGLIIGGMIDGDI